MKLIGECNRCGLCCQSEGFTCVNLQIDGTPGQPGATRCMAYDVRFDGMRIWGRNAAGEVREGRCSKDSAEETRIIKLFIGKGCSLRKE